MFSETFTRSKIFTALALVAVGVIGRFFMLKFAGIPNFEIITALALVSAVYLGRIWGVVVPLSVIAITDVVIGNSPVLIFTWSAFAIIGIFGWLSRSVILNEAKRSEESCTACPPIGGNVRFFRIRGRFLAVLGMTTLGIISSIFFFLYTNFGWWLMTNMYPHTLEGLVRCYVMGLPFLKNNLIGNLIFVPVFSGAAIVVIYLKNNYKLKLNSFKIKERVN